MQKNSMQNRTLKFNVVSRERLYVIYIYAFIVVVVLSYVGFGDVIIKNEVMDMVMFGILFVSSISLNFIKYYKKKFL